MLLSDNEGHCQLLIKKKNFECVLFIPIEFPNYWISYLAWHYLELFSIRMISDFNL